MELLYFWLGLSIAYTSFKGIHREWKAMLLVTIIQLIVVPIIGIWFSYDVPVGNSKSIIIMLALAPGGVTSALAARVMKLDLAVNVAFTSLTALVYLFIVQPIFVPMLVAEMKFSTESLLPFLLSLVALAGGMAVNYFLPKVAKWLDKILAICIFCFVMYHLATGINTVGGVEWSMIWLMVKLHFTIVAVSAIFASMFFGLNRAPLIILESGFHNVSLIAAIGIPLGWSPMMPMIYGIIMFVSASIMAVNVYIIRNWKPKIFLTNRVLKPYRGMAVPPFGIFIRPEFNNRTVIKHELVHWRQFKELGFIGFYIEYAYQILRYGYDKAPLEKEARELSNENKENLLDYSKKIHGKEPLSKINRFLFSGIFLAIIAMVFLAMKSKT
jgi:bile acid:Na+ symporter, BASS family